MRPKNKIPPIIIMLSGKAQSGKDTIAKIIASEMQYGIEDPLNDDYRFFSHVAKIGFADLLKSLCARNHGYKNKKEDREILLRVGDEMREQDPDAFVKPVAHFVEVYRDMGYGVIVVTDTRYQNEYDYMNEYSCGLPYVIRINSTNGHNGISEFTKNHPSEQLEVEYDFQLDTPKLTPDTYPMVIREVRRILGEIISDYRERYN